MTRAVRPDDGPPDATLWRRAAGGDESAFEQLYRRHLQPIYAYCVRDLALDGTACDAEDVVATVFLEAWRQRGNVELVTDSALPWLYAVARHTLANRRRSRIRRRAALGRLAAHHDRPDHTEATISHLDASRRLERVQRAVATMPEADREVLLLCGWQRLDYAEASVALGVPVGTVKSRLSRARARLARLVDQTETALTKGGAS